MAITNTGNTNFVPKDGSNLFFSIYPPFVPKMFNFAKKNNKEKIMDIFGVVNSMQDYFLPGLFFMQRH
jgi:hypothetical protein